ncbi:DeoR/GlpR family DNA-binding transcription regulator [Gryllotalpicola reticulitermitis]|uniref:Lactose phosphotransferase system repressor n=1 Tax=Gryllotalpicola reticulitermitis TaxID=1184153 RepID=A0ABV8Q4L1_9MICO
MPAPLRSSRPWPPTTRRAPHRAERVALLLELLNGQPTASLEEMQTVTGASPVTIRRDLTELESQGLIQRTHGGASLRATASPIDETFALRRRRNANAKSAIASAAADLVRDHTVVLLGDGTTPYALAEELCRRAQPLMIATPAINIAALLAEVSRFEVIVLGGQLRGASFGTVGPLTSVALNTVRADIAFISPDRIDVHGPVFNSFADAEVARAMADRAARLVTLADSSKFSSGGSAMMVGWDRVDNLITDAVDPVLLEYLHAAEVRVGVAAPRL